MNNECNDSKLSRRRFITALTGTGAGIVMAQNSEAQKEKRPEFTGPLVKEKLPDEIEVTHTNDLNMIVIICDTFRWDYLHCSGSNDRILTPNLDALAEEGVYFTNCYADCLPTMPSRRVIHTGRSFLSEGGRWQPLESKDMSFAQIIGKSNFTTGFIVDTFHHFKPGMNYHRGFSSWEWIRGQEADPYISGPRSSINPDDYVPKHLRNDYYREQIIQCMLNTKDRKSDDDYFSAKSCTAAARWLAENKDNDGSFMLFIDMFSPHEAWDAPQKYRKMYRKKYPLEHYHFGYGVDVNDVREDDIPILKDLYSAEVTFSDYCIGRLIKQVKQLGLWDNTIIVFSSDHGTHLGEQGCVQKQAKQLTSCVARVPLIIRHPDRSFKGKRIDALTSHIDFLPTFLYLLGMEGFNGMDGQNMWDIVNDTKSKLRDHVVTGFGYFGSVHTHKWHYFQDVKDYWSKPRKPRNWDKIGRFDPALYDIEKDYHETKNVLDNHPDVVAEMKQILKETFKNQYKVS